MTSIHQEPDDEQPNGVEAQEEYELLLLLERLESLREEMDELGIRDRNELEQRIRDLHRQLGELSGEA